MRKTRQSRDATTFPALLISVVLLALLVSVVIIEVVRLELSDWESPIESKLTKVLSFRFSGPWIGQVGKLSGTNQEISQTKYEINVQLTFGRKLSRIWKNGLLESDSRQHSTLDFNSTVVYVRIAINTTVRSRWYNWLWSPIFRNSLIGNVQD